MKKSMKMIAAAVSVGIALTAGAFAQTQAPASSINELLQRVTSDTRAASAENQERLTTFQNSRNEQQRLLNNARGQLRALETQGDNLKIQFDNNQIQIDERAEELNEAQGAFGELFGVARQSAGEFAAMIDASIISAQFPNRADVLDSVANNRTLPSRAELDYIWNRVTEEMIQQQQVVTFQAAVSGISAGQLVDVTRVGPFLAFSTVNNNQRFTRWTEDTAMASWTLSDMATQPPGQFISGASALYGASTGEIVMGIVDPSRGPLLNIYKDVPDLEARLEQGGFVGQVILTLLALSGSFGLFRMVVLLGQQSAVGAQKRKSKPSKGNPLGRVMLAYEKAKDKDVETMELKLDEAILQESPKLEFGLNFLKLAAGIAPLLGLLGTVTGMIKTFTMITLFGTGDPKIMAGGISEALMTTVLGLVAAIPLLFIHSFAQSFARGVQQVLEEQAAGMVARHAEERS